MIVYLAYAMVIIAINTVIVNHQDVDNAFAYLKKQCKKDYDGLLCGACNINHRWHTYAYREVVERIEKIAVPEDIEMNYNESTDIDIQLLPKSAAADVKVKVTSSNDRLLTVSSNTVTTDKNGKC